MNSELEYVLHLSSYVEDGVDDKISELADGLGLDKAKFINEYGYFDNDFVIEAAFNAAVKDIAVATYAGVAAEHKPEMCAQVWMCTADQFAGEKLRQIFGRYGFTVVAQYGSKDIKAAKFFSSPTEELLVEFDPSAWLT